MATIQCTFEDFNAAFVMFHSEIGNKSNSQESIANLWKGLVLHYIGIQDITDNQLERVVTMLNVAHHGATYRGWDLIEPDLSRPFEDTKNEN